MVVAEGTVKFFRDKLGWGFIELPGGQEVFVHYRDILGEGHKSLAAGDRVEFELEQSPKGVKARQVIRLSR